MMTGATSDLIHVSRSIQIQKDATEVFAFVADMRNDPLWRKEINKTVASGNPQQGIKIEEDSFLSGRTPNHILHLECTLFEAGSRVIYQTVAESPLYLQSIREVNSVAPGITTVTYTISFDKGIVKKGIGFNLPALVIRYVTHTDMVKYLRKLKAILESGSTTA
jgi:hypothetical protein